MKNENATKNTRKVEPFQLAHAIVGIEVNEADDVILQYLHHIFSFLPCDHMKFVHVIPSIPMVDVIPYEVMDEIVLNSEWVSALQERLSNAIPENFSVSNIEFQIREGSPMDALLKEVSGTKDSLLVIGQESGQHNHDISAKSMARSAKSNVLIVPENSGAGLSHILVPIDFSPFSIDALDFAISIANRMPEKIKISCINVFDVPDLSSYKISRTPRQLEDIYKKSHLQMLHKLISEYDTKVEINCTVIRKDMPGIAYYLMNYAQENNADMIVLGAKGHSTFELLLMGSVTEKLLTLNQSIPTFVIK